MAVPIRAYYNQSPIKGKIQVTKIVDSKPVLYRLTIIHAITGLLTTELFPSMDLAIIRSLKFNCNPSLWSVTHS